MNDRDCESCKKFSRVDPHESEGYCGAKRTWVDPQEGEDCKMHEFTLHSATKYKDGTPIMTEPEKIYCDTDSALIHGKSSNQLDTLKNATVENTLRNSFLTKRIDEIEQRIDELSEEYDAVLKIHGDTLEKHKERIINNEGNIDGLCSDVEELVSRICNLEYLYEQLISKLCAIESHNGSNFCGNCLHATIKDGICACNLSKEIIDPDSASCSMFEPSFTHVDDRPDWMEKIRKDLTTPAEPTEGCKDCKCAVDGMCVKYNCSLGAICATPECFEPPF